MSFVYTSNILFANNLLNKKNSWGYIIKLFGGATAWKVNKQDIISSSIIKAELFIVF